MAWISAGRFVGEYLISSSRSPAIAARCTLAYTASGESAPSAESGSRIKSAMARNLMSWPPLHIVCRIMPRQILDESRIHPAIRETISTHHADIVREVQEAIAANAVVVVGMRQNPMPKYARKVLDNDRIAYKYLEYGSYLSG